MKIDLTKLKREKSIQELLEFSIINIDKPVEHTSFDVDSRVKGMLRLRKTSHFGTLDPMVTGVLPVALNRACKLLDYFMHRDKVYVGEMHIHKSVNKKDLEKEMKKFIGIIEQMPPIKSSVKRALRKRRVNDFKILKFDEEKRNVEFIADVEAGTYIRKLCSDLGDKLGCGAHMTKLRRTRAGLFDDKNLITIEKVFEVVEKYKQGDETGLRKILIPAEIITELYPVVQVKEELVKNLLQGKAIHKGIVKEVDKMKLGEVFLVFYKERFIGVYDRVEKKCKTKDDIYGKAKFVMQEMKG